MILTKSQTCVLLQCLLLNDKGSSRVPHSSWSVPLPAYLLWTSSFPIFRFPLPSLPLFLDHVKLFFLRSQTSQPYYSYMIILLPHTSLTLTLSCSSQLKSLSSEHMCQTSQMQPFLLPSSLGTLSLLVVLFYAFYFLLVTFTFLPVSGTQISRSMKMNSRPFSLTHTTVAPPGHRPPHYVVQSLRALCWVLFTSSPWLLQ